MTNTRLRILTIILPFVSLFLVIRLFYWQIIRGPELAIKANRQHEQTVQLTARRGEILDSQGNVLAGTNNQFHLSAYKPSLSKDRDKMIEEIALIISPESSQSGIKETRDYLQSRLSLSSNWISLKHYLNQQQKNQIEEKNYPGLSFDDEYVRYYPEASAAASVLGFVGKDSNGLDRGYFGIEGFFDRELQGREGKLRLEKDASGHPILLGKYDRLESLSGRTIGSTIDRRLQYLTDSILASGLKRYEATSGGIIVMETKTGKIRAMSSLPSYDPAHFSDYPSDLFKNPNTSSLYEPGSTFKVLIMASALNEDLITPETTCDICAGPVNIGKYWIKTWNEEYHKDATMKDVIKNSDNTGMVFVGRKLGAEKLHQYLSKLGFGEKTGIESEEEVSADLKDVTKIKEIDIATISFGQGIVATPIQLITAVNTIANQGYFVKPTLVDKFTENGKTHSFAPQPPIKIFSQNTVSQITDMMINAVEHGEAKWKIPPNIRFAGKTGTAQIAIEGHYDQEKTIASFVGFFPAQDPRFTMLVTLKEPKTSPWGSETAAPLWFSLATRMMSFL